MARVTGRRISVTYQVSTSFHLLLYVGKGLKFRQVRPETLEVVTELFFFYYLYWLANKRERNSVYYVTVRMNERGTCDYHVTRVWPSVYRVK